MNFGLPFEGHDKAIVIPPTEFSKIPAGEAVQAKDIRRLIQEHLKGIGRELGCALELGDSSNSTHEARWLIGPTAASPEIRGLNRPAPKGPELYIDRKRKLLVSDGTTADEVIETFSWLRSLANIKDGLWEIRNCESIERAVERIYTEVKSSFPAFALHGVDWDEISARHRPRVLSAMDPIPAMQKWLAELGDAHTWVRPIPAYGQFPYDLQVIDGRVYFYRLTKDSVGWHRGVRPGFELVAEDISDWWQRTSASPHGKPFVVGARLLATPLGTDRNFQVRAPNGALIEWSEPSVANRWVPLLSKKILSSGTAYLRIEAWLAGQGLDEAIDEAFVAFRSAPKLIVDLRANPGGNLLMAHRFRNRFLQTPGSIAWIRTTLPDGRLGEREPIVGEVVDDGSRWLKPVVFLTDALTYSAAEDVLLGLAGQPHVKLVGQRSGGGSGRVRLLKLLAGWRLTVSTALTYDLADFCIEGAGIPIDREFPISLDPDELIEAADKL